MSGEDKGPLGGPNCYRCIYRRDLPGDAHSQCLNLSAKTSGDAHGYRRGWFFWPFNFDPTWLLSCTGFEAIQPQPQPAQEAQTA